MAETIELYENWLVFAAVGVLFINTFVLIQILRAIKKRDTAYDGEYIVQVRHKDQIGKKR